jgi:tRNA-binding protein
MSSDGEQSTTITFDDFLKVDIRVGTVIEAEPFPEARTPETLVGRQVAAVVNFPPRQIGKFMSEVLALGFSDEAGGIVLIAPDKTVPNGGRMH